MKRINSLHMGYGGNILTAVARREKGRLLRKRLLTPVD